MTLIVKTMNVISWIQYIATFGYLLLLALYTYLKVRLFGRQSRAPPLSSRRNRIAIVGGGIGGISAAYALLRSGYEHVTVYEAAERLGGNAKTHLWQVGKDSLRTGLSVLAWPIFFRNYIQLLEELNIATTTVQLPFFIHNREEKRFFAHNQQHRHTQEYQKDLQRWRRMVNMLGSISAFFHGKEISLYHFSLFNPFNYVPLRVLSRLFGISDRFWNQIIVPMYASSFLSTKLSYIPSSILPVIDRIISVQPDQSPTLQTWAGTSIDVFDRMTQGVTIKTNHRVKKVRVVRTANHRISISVDDDPTIYDRIIFACHADAALQALIHGKTSISTFLKVMLANVTYSDDEDSSLLDGVIHRDPNIFPAEYVHDLRHHYANYIDVRHNRRNNQFYHYNTFILSSWLPTVHAMINENGWQVDQFEPMLVTYDPIDQPKPTIDPKKIVGQVNNRRAHPSLSSRNQAIALLIRLVQGDNGIYFCGNAVTPANGHDLSLLSGFAVAERIGANYPFEKNQLALNDYQRFKRMCVY